jgi:signal transduction histidine kinase
MHKFLSNNRDDLIARCKVKIAQRPKRAATAEQLANGIPLFLAQLTKTLEAEEQGNVAEGVRISGPAGGDTTALSEIGLSAAAHGKELLNLGCTFHQVVHDYGDLCQAITDLAVERDAPFSVDQFRTLNRCLDNAIADAVSEFATQRDATVLRQQSSDENARLGALAHELRNFLMTATMAFAALESGKVPIGGSTGALVKRSLSAISELLQDALSEVKAKAGLSDQPSAFSLAAFIAEAKDVASLDAAANGCTFTVPVVDPVMGIAGNRDHLLAAVNNLLQNAFKFTHPRSEVTLHAYGTADRVMIDVSDNCGGLPPGFSEKMFRPFAQGNPDRSGLGLGLSIARRTVESNGGSLAARYVPGHGCVFSVSLPRHMLR